MEITVIGAGAIGGVLGAYLAKAGENVLLCDIAQEHVQKIQNKGLTIEGPNETFTVPCEALTPDQLVERGKPLEAVLLCVKAQHTKEAVKQILPLLTEKSFVISVQNGLCEKVIADLIGIKRTVGCFVNFSADYLRPGTILYGGVAALYIGELDGTISERVQLLHEKLKSWGPAQVTDNISGFLWGKMSYAGLLYATALVDETMATVVRNLDLRDTLMELCSEILEVAEKEKIVPLGFDDWEPGLVYPREKRKKDVLDLQLEKLAERMATNKKTKSGIWRDLAVRKRKTEIHDQLVPIIELGKKHSIEMPLTTYLVKLIKELEDGTKQMNWDHLYNLKYLYETRNIHESID